MNQWLLNILADPVSNAPLSLESAVYDGEEVRTGKLVGSDGGIYTIKDGIPRFVLTEDEGQRQTEQSFGFKWQQQATYGSKSSMGFYRTWFLEKYGFESIEAFRAYLGSDTILLDAGCGSGYTSSLFLGTAWMERERVNWVGADISEAIDVAQEHLGESVYTHFVQGDVLQLPFKPESFDFVISEGVLHHTPSTERAIKAVVPLLKPGGEFMFYVYRKKGAIREFSDDYIREVISSLPPEQAWMLLEPLTKLGKALADLKAEIDVPEDVPYLGIKAGRYDIQRLLYWHFLKLFWNDAYSFDENQHINFDWYHPTYAHRQTEEDIRRWCTEAGLSIIHFDTQQLSGYTVRATKE